MGSLIILMQIDPLLKKIRAENDFYIFVPSDRNFCLKFAPRLLLLCFH